MGAGFAGLAAADELVRAGVEVRVLEARDRVGGRVWSAPFAGATVERGAEFVLPGYEVMLGLAARLGLGLVRKGTLYGYREPRGGREPVTLAAVGEALERLGALAPRPGESVAAALARSALQPAVADAIAARLEVSCAHPADDLEAGALHEGAGSFGTFDSHSLAGGNDVLARALAAELGARMTLGSAVEAVRWRAGGVRVRGSDLDLAADALVLTVPASVTDRIAFDPPLPTAKREALAAVTFGHAAKLFVELARPAPPSAVLSVPERYWCWTQLGAHGEPLRVLGAFAGSPAALRRLRVDEGPERWLQSLHRLRPELELRPETAMLCTWADDPWVLGAYTARTLRSPLRTDALAAPVGPIAFAGEHTAGAWHGLMEGGLRSGIRAARELLAT